MNNEPVAYWDGKHFASKDKSSLANIPLYTHPVKEHFEDEPQAEELHEIMQSNAELTDEEIYRLLADSIWAVGLNTDCLDEQNWDDGITVARAILRKASEK